MKISSKSLKKKILILLKNKKAGFAINEISDSLKIAKKDFKGLKKSLNSLCESGQILKSKKNKKYLIASKSRFIKNELVISRNGYGFVFDQENNVDIFIGREHLNTGLDGDLVEVKLFATSRGKNEEGYVSRIVQRKHTSFVGTFHKTQYYGYVVPDNPKIYRDFYIPREKQSLAQHGQKVVVSLEKWETDHLNPEGKIKEIIGFPGQRGVDVASIAYSYQLDLKFPKEVELEAEKIHPGLNHNEIVKRLDLRDKICITIDPENARDFDDAVSLELLANGIYMLGVHIADVSFYIDESSAIDREAFKRGTSVYLVDRVIPMLPEKISNSICSLQPKMDKLTFSCIMKLSATGEILEYKILPTIINSKRRFTYEEVQNIIDSNAKDPYATVLHNMMALSKILTRIRLEQGGIDFETPEVSFKLKEDGSPQEIKRIKRLDSHRLIEEFMLLANKTVAQHILNIDSQERLRPFIYRIHDKPDSEKMDRFFEFLNLLGYKADPRKCKKSKYLQGILTQIKGTKEEILVEELALRSMMKAEYSVKNIGHFGLGFKEYTHFTSPIRRFPDLTVHRLLKMYMNEEKAQDINTTESYLEKVCKQSTRMERIALEAERSSIRLKQIEYISSYIGEQFRGIISGVTAFGIFIELYETLVEGLIHIKDLDGHYIYDEKTYTLIGHEKNQILRLGDEVLISVKNVNLEEGKVDFLLVQKKG